MSDIRGTNRADILAALADGDKVFGLGGPDCLTSGFNRTRLYGGDGADRLTTTFAFESETAPEPPLVTSTHYGGAGDDQLVSVLDVRTEGSEITTLRNTLAGGDGHDTIRAEGTLWQGGEVRNTVWGAAGNDSVTASAFAAHASAVNVIAGGTGRDTIVASATTIGAGDGAATNEILGGFGDDVVTATASAYVAANTLYGDGGADTLDATATAFSASGNPGMASNTLYGGVGGDDLTARLLDPYSETGDRPGAVTPTNALYGGAGVDALRAEIGELDGESVPVTGANRLVGGDGGDTLTGIVELDAGSRVEASNDLYGGDGDDALTAVALAETFSGSDAFARNTLDGGDGDDILFGQIDEGEGANRLFGSAGDDRLTASGGDDNVLSGGSGADVMRASDGVDTFVFDLAEMSDDLVIDRVYAFDPSRDRLAFFGVADAGAPGILDDLTEIVFLGAGGPETYIRLFFPDQSVSVRFAGLGSEGPATFADLVDDPASQLVLATPDLLV